MSSIRLESAKQTSSHSVSKKTSQISAINKSTSKPDSKSVRKNKPDPTRDGTNKSVRSVQNKSISKNKRKEDKEKSILIRRTKLEIILIGVVLLCLVVICILLAVLLTRKSEEPAKRSIANGTAIGSADVEICITPTCASVASMFLDAIDFSKDPCDDFWNYACGKWDQNTRIPDGLQTVGILQNVIDSVMQKLRIAMESYDPIESRSEKQVRLMYKRCMEMDTIENLKSKPLYDLFQRLGGWPLLQQGWNNKATLTDLISNVRTILGQHLFFEFTPEQGKNGSRLNLLNSNVVMSNAKPLEADDLVVYKTLISNFANAMANDAGLNLNNDTLKMDVERIVNLEYNLLFITAFDSNNTDFKWSLEYFQRSMKSVELGKVLKEITPKDVYEKFVQSTNFTITINKPDDLKRLDGLLSNESIENIFNFAMWKSAFFMYNLLDVNRFGAIFDAFTKLSNAPTENEPSTEKEPSTPKEPRWQFCLDNIMNMEKVLSAIYVKKYFHADDKVEVTKMVANLKNSFESIIKNADWMDKETKSAATDKLHAIAIHVGYSNFVMDTARLDAYYADLNFTNETSFFDMMVQGIIWAFKNSMRELIQPLDRDRDLEGVYTVNAFYEPDQNSIYFPAAILQSPLFKKDFPKAINYGSIGGIIGHEITHGFDNLGGAYDKNGDRFNWWSKSSAEQFHIKTKCMRNQYANYPIPGFKEKTDGNETLGENIADNGGLKESFAAYKKVLKDLGKPEPKLPGLDASNEQLFFLSYGLLRCTKRTRADTIRTLKADVHAPDYVRLNVPLSNMAEFSSAFQCKSGTKMNPEHKCIVW